MNQHWVVVAAHCVAEPGGTEPLRADDLNVVMGKHVLIDSKTLQHIQVRAFAPHSRSILTEIHIIVVCLKQVLIIKELV